MAWIGDSTARRVGLTLWSLLESDTEHVSTSAVSLWSVIDVAKKDDQFECNLFNQSHYRPKICRNIPNRTGKLWHIRLNCWNDIDVFFQNELAGEADLLDEFSLIVIAGGIWEIERPWDCRQPGRTVHQVLASLIQTIDSFQQNKTKLIVFRGSGYSDNAGGFEKTKNMSDFLMDEIDRYTFRFASHGLRNNVTYINWNGAVEPRSLGSDRIKGDIKAHYGSEPRIVMIHQLTNFLMDRGFVDEHNSSSS